MPFLPPNQQRQSTLSEWPANKYSYLLTNDQENQFKQLTSMQLCHVHDGPITNTADIINADNRF